MVAARSQIAFCFLELQNWIDVITRSSLLDIRLIPLSSWYEFMLLLFTCLNYYCAILEYCSAVVGNERRRNRSVLRDDNMPHFVLVVTLLTYSFIYLYFLTTGNFGTIPSFRQHLFLGCGLYHGIGIHG
jgi:hypothetical protein